MRHVLDLPTSSPIPKPAVFPEIAGRSFSSAHDVARYAVDGGILSGDRRTHSWHLDRTGEFTCGTRATVCDSLESWSAHPKRLIDAFLTARPALTCSPHWVVIDERPTSGFDACSPPGEHDAEQFLRLRRQLEVAGITLMDAVIFDDQRQWWSMCELLTGSAEWKRPAAAA